MSEPGDVTLATYQRAAERYRELSSQRTAEILGFLDRVAHLVGSGRVLELGSGPGIDADYLESRGAQVDRSDGTPAFIEMMRAGGHDAALLDIRVGEFGGPYDAILASAVLLHLTRAEFERVLRKALAAVVPGGFVAFTLKEGDGEAWSDAKLRSPRHFTYWREQDVRTALVDAGWSGISIDHVAGRTEPWLFVIGRREPGEVP